MYKSAVSLSSASALTTKYIDVLTRTRSIASLLLGESSVYQWFSLGHDHICKALMSYLLMFRTSCGTNSIFAGIPMIRDGVSYVAY